MTAIPTLWFIRHGQTDWNAEGRLQGSRDTNLNERGRGQAAEAARRLQRVAGRDLHQAAFLCSPLTRARATMEIVRAEFGLVPDAYGTDDRLREIGFGYWEGSTWAEIRRRDPAGAAARERDRWHYQPGGPNAESYAMVTERVAALTAEIVRPTVLVAHGGIARALLVTLGALDTRTAVRTSVRQGRVLVFDGPRWHWI